MSAPNQALQEKPSQTRTIIVFFVFCLLFLVVNFSMKTEWLKRFDDQLGSVIRDMRSDALTSFFKLVTQFGSTKVYGVILLLFGLYMLYKWKNKRYPVVLALCILGAWGLNTTIKYRVQRARPEVEHLMDASGYSFPSANAMISMAFYGLIAYILSKHFAHKSSIKVASVLVASLLILLVGVSRVYLGVHYPTDILAGWAAGGAWFIICLFGASEWEQQKQ